MTIRSQLKEMCGGKKAPAKKKVIKESCTSNPGERAVVWHVGVRYQFRNGMWATPRGYVWPNTELCTALDAAYEAQVHSGKSYAADDQQGVGIPQTLAGAKQFVGNVEDRKADIKLAPLIPGAPGIPGGPAKEGTPNTGATSPNEAVEPVEERGLKPNAAAPFKSWGGPGYERRLLTLFAGANYGIGAVKPVTSESTEPKLDHQCPKCESTDIGYGPQDQPNVKWRGSAECRACGFHGSSVGGEFSGHRQDEAKVGRPRAQIGVRTYQGKGSPRKRIRGADGVWRWASKNRV
jgi:hypothetical protein